MSVVIQDPTEISWDQFLERDDLIGGDVELSGMDLRGWRGPLTKMEDAGDHVKFTCAWIARKLKTEDAWRKRGFTTFTLAKGEPLPREYTARPNMVVVYGACCQFEFHKKGTYNLDPARVRGLQPEVA